MDAAGPLPSGTTKLRRGRVGSPRRVGPQSNQRYRHESLGCFSTTPGTRRSWATGRSWRKSWTIPFGRSIPFGSSHTPGHPATDVSFGRHLLSLPGSPQVYSSTVESGSVPRLSAYKIVSVTSNFGTVGASESLETPDFYSDSAFPSHGTPFASAPASLRRALWRRLLRVSDHLFSSRAR